MTAVGSGGELIEALKINLDKELIALIEKVAPKKSGRKTTLYHYTNLHSLKAIVENQSLLCSNSAYLNDKKEYLYGLELFRNVLNNKKEKVQGLELKIIDGIQKELDAKKISNHFVTCFSREGDLLSQWRAYADDGKGIAIGFDLNKLIEGFQNKATGFYVQYDKEANEELVEKIITTIIAYCIQTIEGIKEEVTATDFINQGVIKEISELIDKYVGYFKHSSFEEEKEFRFEMSVDEQFKESVDEILYRVGRNNLLVPYKELKTNYKLEQEKLKKLSDDQQPLATLSMNRSLKIKSLPITKIIIGPSLDFDLNSYAIEQFLKKHDYNNVAISPSEVPYRI